MKTTCKAHARARSQGRTQALVAAALALSACAAQAQTSVDLSLYQLVGRHSLPEPNFVPVAPGDTTVLAQEASGVTWNRATNSLFVIGDGSRAIVQVDLNGQLIDYMQLGLVPTNPQGTAFYDTEGISAVGNNQFIIVEERLRTVSLVNYTAGTTLGYGDAPHIKLGTTVGNIGIEGISWDPLTNGIVAVKEINPQGIFQTALDWNTRSASNGSASTVNSVNLFDPALMGLADIADVYAMSNITGIAAAEQDHLLVLSQASGRIVEVDRLGNIYSTLAMPDLGNGLSVADTQHEGLTMDDRGFLYVVSENGGGSINYPELWVFAPVPEPSTVALWLAGLGLGGLVARRRLPR